MAEKQASEQLELIRSRLPRSPRRPPRPRPPRPRTRWPRSRSTRVWRTSTDPSSTPCPQSLAETAQPGARVKVRFAGQDLDGFVLERRADRRARGQAGAAAPGRLPRARADPAVLAPPGSWPSGTPARWATCSDSPSRHATRQRRRPCPCRPRTSHILPTMPGPAPGRRPRRRGRGGCALVGALPGGTALPRAPRRRWRARRVLACPADDGSRRGLARGAGRGGAHRARRGPGQRPGRTGPPRCRAGRRRPRRCPRPRSARPPHGGPGPAGAVHRLAEGASGPRAGRRRHPRRGPGAGA